MSPKILTVLLIVLCFAQYSRQDDAPAVKPATATVAAPVTYVAPRAWSADRNHDGVVDWRDRWRTTGALPVDWNRDGVVDWRDGWRTTGALPVDWNRDGVVDWRDGWRTNSALPVDWNRDGVVDWRDGWTSAYAPARNSVDWNRDGLIDWRDDLAWNGAWGGYRGNLAPATEPVVTRKLGSNASTASILRSQRRQDGLRAIGSYITIKKLIIVKPFALASLFYSPQN